MQLRIFNLRPGAGSDIAANIDHEDLIRHIDLPLMHVIQHLFGAFRPNLIISGVTEETNADDDISLQGQLLLRLHESVLKAGAAAKGNDSILPYHNLSASAALFYAQGLKYRVFRAVVENKIEAANQL